MERDGKKAVSDLSAENGASVEAALKRVSIRTDTIEKMKRFYPLFAEDPAKEVKEADIIAFFVEKSFAAYIASGAVEQRVLEIAGKGNSAV